MRLKTSYRFIAPFYDLVIERGIAADIRRRSLAKLPQQGAASVLIGGAGTGLDFPFLPPCHEYTALDLTAAMLARAKPRVSGLQMRMVRGDSMALPFAGQSFDYVVLHLNPGGGGATAEVPGRGGASAKTGRAYPAV